MAIYILNMTALDIAKANGFKSIQQYVNQNNNITSRLNEIMRIYLNDGWYEAERVDGEFPLVKGDNIKYTAYKTEYKDGDYVNTDIIQFRSGGRLVYDKNDGNGKYYGFRTRVWGMSADNAKITGLQDDNIIRCWVEKRKTIPLPPKAERVMHFKLGEVSNFISYINGTIVAYHRDNFTKKRFENSKKFKKASKDGLFDTS